MHFTKHAFLTAAVFALFVAPVLATEVGPRGGSTEQATTVTRMIPTLSAKGAQDIVDAVTALAKKRNQNVTIAIVDASGELLHFQRMDGVGLGTINAAIGKARSALQLQAPTQVFSDMAKHDLGLALGFLSSDFTILGGGQPIRINGIVVGGVAVSGGAGGEDDLYNNAGLAAVGAAK
jgi:glc operon protein GlcG